MDNVWGMTLFDENDPWTKNWNKWQANNLNEERMIFLASLDPFLSDTRAREDLLSLSRSTRCYWLISSDLLQHTPVDPLEDLGSSDHAHKVCFWTICDLHTSGMLRGAFAVLFTQTVKNLSNWWVEDGPVWWILLPPHDTLPSWF